MRGSYQLSYSLSSEEESQQLAQILAPCLRPPLRIAFSGCLGAGKTTMVRAVLRALGVSSAVKSPTYSLVESYDFNDWQLHHFDLYRIEDEEELDYLGFRDYINDHSICCIEWPEKALAGIGGIDLWFKLAIKGEGRELLIEALTAPGKAVITCLAGN